MFDNLCFVFFWIEYLRISGGETENTISVGIGVQSSERCALFASIWYFSGLISWSFISKPKSLMNAINHPISMGIWNGFRVEFFE